MMPRTAEARTAQADRPLVRIVFALPEGEKAGTETLWAEALDDGVFKLRNTPLYVEGVSYDDTIEALPDRGGMLVFTRVLGRGGHSTYRVMIRPELAPGQADELRQQLLNLGASIESQTQRLFALDIPPTTSIVDAYKLLQGGLDGGIWWFDEMHVGHPLT